MKEETDVCVVGSGAGGGPVAASLAEAGYRVTVLEKGPRYGREAFLKDEITWCRRPTLWPRVEDEPQVEEWGLGQEARATRTTAYWNGSVVGGSSVLMSGYFLRLKPDDFRLRARYGEVEGGEVADWPIDYEDLEPYYARVEQEVGVSGRVTKHVERWTDRRSTPALAQPPMNEHPVAAHIDRVLGAEGLHPFPEPRAVLSRPRGDRKACEYAGYCGSYGCTSGAKGSSLEVFLPRAEATGRCQVRSRAMVTRLESDEDGVVRRAHWVDRHGQEHQVEASLFVVACQAIETARLLLLSKGPAHPKGLANGSGLVGRHLLFSVYGGGRGTFPRASFPEFFDSAQPFVNRASQDFYEIADERGARRGGTLSFLLRHPNPIYGALSQALWDRPEDEPIWGRPLRKRLLGFFREARQLDLEVFGDFIPNPIARVTLDPAVRDRFGLPVARIKAHVHERSRETALRLSERGLDLVRRLGGKDVRPSKRVGAPSVNLVGGTCRFGRDPKQSVLDPDCRAHEVPNLFVTDGSFMPSGGSVPFTFTIYANALRVADKAIEQLGGPR